MGKGVVEQVVGAAVQTGGRDYLIAGMGQGQEGQGDGRLAGSHTQGGNTPFQGSYPLLEDIRGGFIIRV